MFSEFILNIGICPEADAPYSAEEQAIFSTGRAAYADGMPARERQMLPGYDSTVVCLLLGLFIFITVNFKHYTTFIKSMGQELLNVRRRANAFDDHTVNETRILLSLVLVVCFSEAVLVFSALRGQGVIHSIVPGLPVMILIALVYYVLQLVAYSTVGNVFGDKTVAAQWLKGFNASQSLLGIVIILPALVTLFYPGTWSTMFAVGIVSYIVARIIFICKGFKIFYHNFFSLLYFILYLCALEIAPLLVTMRCGNIINSL